MVGVRMSIPVLVGKKSVSENDPVYLIAEIGINHNGDLETAKELIRLAKECGFDAVKFQKRTIEIVYSSAELAKERPNHFGNTNGHLKRGLEFGINEYALIDKYCRELGIHWFASPWDTESVDFLEKFDVVAHKVASACLTDAGLLNKLAATGKPVFLSTGMSTVEQIEKAVSLLTPGKVILMHAVSVYPAREDQLNLSVIDEMKRRFPEIPIGYSGHEVGVIPSVIAVAKYGAVTIERHITLDRSLWGSDQAASLEPDGFKRVAQYIRSIPVLAGTPAKRILEEEFPILDKLRRVKDF
jgi:N-acetylneuraminate synthase